MAIVAIIRPGNTDYDEQERIQGALDLPLSDLGEVQTGLIVEQLRNEKIDQILTSPTDPAVSTSKAIGEALGIPVKELEGLENIDHGLWQGLCFDEIRRKQPKVFKQWNETPESVCPPEGETCDEAVERARKVLKKAIKRKEEYAVVCIEPMATLIKSIVEGEEPCLPKPGPRNGRPLVEKIGRPTELKIADTPGPAIEES